MSVSGAHHDLAVVAVLQARMRLTHVVRVLTRDVDQNVLDARHLLAVCDTIGPLVTALEHLLPEPRS